jgi:heme/copper-type cytochrome/quinol oxidase subunit 2
MAKFTSTPKMSNNSFLTCCNILLCITVVILILYILGYVNIKVSQKEGLSKGEKTGVEIGFWIAAVVGFIMLIAIWSVLHSLLSYLSGNGWYGKILNGN